MATETKPAFEIVSSEEVKKANANKKAARAWKLDLIKYLADNPAGATDIEIYNATRPDRLEIADAKKKHNVASQWTYISEDALATIELVGDKRVLRKVSEKAAKAIGLIK